MKVGTLAKHPWWGKCLVVENLLQCYDDLPRVRVLWNKPATTPFEGYITTDVYEEDLTILSEPEG